jgi:integrase
MLLMAKRTPAWRAAHLGHSVEMFLRIYSKWIEPDQADREVSAFEDWLSSTDGGRSDPSDARGRNGILP